LRYAAIGAGGRITRITTSPLPSFPAEVIIEAPDEVSDISHKFVSGQFVVAPVEIDEAAELAKRRAQMVITSRQLFIGMVRAGWCTAAEGVAAATSGAIPAMVETAIATLPTEAEQVATRITWASMTRVERADPLVDVLAAAVGITEAEVDQFFTECSGI
jgi:hypothetical protein